MAPLHRCILNALFLTEDLLHDCDEKGQEFPNGGYLLGDSRTGCSLLDCLKQARLSGDGFQDVLF